MARKNDNKKRTRTTRTRRRGRLLSRSTLRAKWIFPG